MVPVVHSLCSSQSWLGTQEASGHFTIGDTSPPAARLSCLQHLHDDTDVNIPQHTLALTQNPREELQTLAWHSKPLLPCQPSLSLPCSPAGAPTLSLRNYGLACFPGSPCRPLSAQQLQTCPSQAGPPSAFPCWSPRPHGLDTPLPTISPRPQLP